jgi:hypothetical protein
MIIMFACMALFACGVGWMLNKYNVSLALISIGMDYFQVVSMFARTRIRWPPQLKQVFMILSAFNLNLDIAAPECAIPVRDEQGAVTALGLQPLPWDARRSRTGVTR